LEQESHWRDVEEQQAEEQERATAHPSHSTPEQKSEANRVTQPYTEQPSAEPQDSAANDSEEEADRELLFSRCDEPVKELFGRVFSDFKQWLDQGGQVFLLHVLAPQNLDVNLLFFTHYSLNSGHGRPCNPDIQEHCRAGHRNSRCALGARSPPHRNNEIA
jgi:hypothetical protein